MRILSFAMKIIGIIFSIQLTLISAALFGGFSRGIFSVHNSIGRLMTDVITKVKQNINCSIQSMQSVLDKGKPAPYTSNSRCNGPVNHRVRNTNSIQNVDTASSNSIKVNKVTNERNLMNTKQQSPKEDIPRSAVNKTILNIINKEVSQRKLDEINNIPKIKSDQLYNVNVLMKQKIDAILKDVSEGLKKIEQYHKDLLIEKIIHEIELLREQKQNDSSKFDEIRQIAKDVLNVLNKNDTTSEVITSLEADELKKIITDLERYSNILLNEIGRQFKDWEKLESNQLYSIKNILERQQLNFSSENRRDDKPLSFKSIAKNIFEGKSVYSNHTDSEVMLNNGADTLNKSKTVKYESIGMTTENFVEDNHVSLSMKHIDSNKDNVTKSFTILANISGIPGHISSTEKYIATEIVNQITLIDDIDNKSMPLNISSNLGNVSDISNGVKLVTTESFLSTNQIYFNNAVDTTTESFYRSTNMDGVLNDTPTMRSVNKYAITENSFPANNRRNHNEAISNESEFIDTSTTIGNITNLMSAKNANSTFIINQSNYSTTTTEFTYPSTKNTDYNLVDTPAVSSVEDRVTTGYSYTDKIGPNYDIVKKSKSNNRSINKNKILDILREEKLMTTKNLADTNYVNSNTDSIEKEDSIETSTNTNYITNLPKNEHVSIESHILHKLNLNDNNETSMMYSSTIANVTPNIKSSEYSTSTTQTNTGLGIDNESESSDTSNNINLSEILTSENSSTNEILSNDRIHKEFIISSTNFDDLTDVPREGSQMTTDFLAPDQTNVIIETSTDFSVLYTSMNTDNGLAAKLLTHQYATSVSDVPSIDISAATENYSAQTIYSNDKVKEKATIVTPTYYTGDALNISSEENLLTTKTFVPKINVDSYNNIAEETESIDTSTVIDIKASNLEIFVTSENPYDMDNINSNNKIYKDIKSISTSTNTDLLDTPNLDKNMPTENSSSKISANDDIDQESFDDSIISDISNVDNLETTEYYLTTNEINADFNTPTETVYISANTDNVLVDASDVQNVDVLVSTENYHADYDVFSNKDTVEESIENLETTENIDSTNHVGSYFNITDSFTASTNIGDIEHNESNVEEFVTSKKPFDMKEITSNNMIYINTESVSTSTISDLLNTPIFDIKMSTESSSSKIYSNYNIDHKTESFNDISDMFSVRNIETTEYYFTNNQINAGFNTPTETFYTLANTDNVLVDAIDVPDINIAVTTDNYLSADKINSIENTVAESEENFVTTEKLDSTYHVDSYYNDIITKDYYDTSTKKVDIINVSSVEQFVTSEKLNDMDEINSIDNIYKKTKFISTSTYRALLDTPDIEKNEPTESSSSKINSNDDIDKESEAFDISTDASSVKNLETTEYYFTTNTEFNTPTENVHTLKNTDKVSVDAIDVPSIDIIVTTDNYNFDNRRYSNDNPIGRSAFVDISSQKGHTVEVSSEENLVTTENLISTNQIAFNNDIAQLVTKEYDFIDTSTNIDDIVSGVKEFVTSEKPMNEIFSNVDINQDTKFIDSNSDDALDVSNVKKMKTAYTIPTKPIILKINKHTESIKTSTQIYGAPSVEEIATTEHSFSTKQIISSMNIDTNTEDILTNTDEEPNASNLDKYLPAKNDPFQQTKKQSDSFMSSSEDLKLLPKRKTGEQAVKLALKIFEQSKRSQKVMRNVFKNEKYAKDLF